MFNLGARRTKEMKITRRQLRRLLEQAAEKLSDEEKAAAEKKIKDEGGALGKDDFVKTVNDVDPDVNYSEEEALRRAKASIEDFNLHVDSDVYTDRPGEINEILGLPSGQFDIKSIGRSGGPEMRSEEEYLKKAKAASVDLRKYEPIIEAAAYTHNVQYDLLYGILIDEHIRMYPRAIFDVLGYIGLMDTSVGVSQMRGSRAKQLSSDGYYVPEGYTAEDIESMSIGQLQRIIADSPKVAINYAAGYINYIIDNWELGDKNKFFNQLEKNTRIATIYSLGRADEFEGRTPDPVTGYEDIKPPGPSTRGSRAATVPSALRGDSDLADIITENEIRRIILEKLEKIGFYNKYSYGLDDVPNKTKAHDDIIGHT